MYTRRLIPFLGFFLLLSGGQSMQMIDRADAICCPTPRCGTWPWMVQGTAVVTNPKVRITTPNLEKAGLFFEASVSENLLKLFNDEKAVGNPVHGFAVIWFDGMTDTMIAFIPNTREHEGGEKEKVMNANQAMKFYNEAFEKFVMEQGKPGKQRGSSMP